MNYWMLDSEVDDSEQETIRKESHSYLLVFLSFLLVNLKIF